jgi:hypothetical protein
LGVWPTSQINSNFHSFSSLIQDWEDQDDDHQAQSYSLMETNCGAILNQLSQSKSKKRKRGDPDNLASHIHSKRGVIKSLGTIDSIDLWNAAASAGISESVIENARNRFKLLKMQGIDLSY